MSETFQQAMEFGLHIGNLALEKKANRVQVLDVHKFSSLTDVFVICSGETDVQVKAITDHILNEVAAFEKPLSREGYDNREWVLLDYFNVVVHVFHESAREYYNIERLWPDAVVTELKDEAPASPETPLFDDL